MDVPFILGQIRPSFINKYNILENITNTKDFESNIGIMRNFYAQLLYRRTQIFMLRIVL